MASTNGAAGPELPPWKELTAEEMGRLLDERAREYLHMSGEEFLAALEAGTLPDTAAVAHLATLAGAGARSDPAGGPRPVPPVPPAVALVCQ